MQLISHFASGSFLASSFSQFLLQALRQFLHGNDVHLPSVFGKGRLYIVPEGYFCILELV
jgi:predicted flavoprotein YhiN